MPEHHGANPVSELVVKPVVFRKCEYVVVRIIPVGHLSTYGAVTKQVDTCTRVIGRQ